MVEYIEELKKYLPLDFGDADNNEFKDYYIKSYIDNCERNNLQLSFLSFHILFMAIIYKHFWFLKNYSFSHVAPLINNNKNYESIENLFAVHEITESSAVRDILARISFDSNESKKVVELVEIRNSCAHACGKIYYKAVSEIEDELRKAIKQEEKIFRKIKNCIKNVFINLLHEFWDSSDYETISSFDKIEAWVVDLTLSPIEIQYILETSKEEFLSQYNEPTYIISYYIMMEALRNKLIDSNIYDYDEDAYFKALGSYINNLTIEQYESITGELENEINRLYQKYSTISYEKFIECLD